MKRSHRTLCIVLICVTCFSLCCCNTKKKKFSNTFFDYFDTFASITIFANTQDEYDIYESIFLEKLEYYHKLLDSFNTYDGLVNLCSLNEVANSKEFTRVDTELFEFIKYAIKAYNTTNGYTSFSMGTVTSLWKQAIIEKRLPDREALEEAARHTDISKIELDEVIKGIRFHDEVLMLDAGALAKGYVADVIRNDLVAVGCDSFLINIGGNLCAFGQKDDGSDWYGGIQKPDGDGELDVSLNISGMSVSTSGSYYRSFTKDGKVYHHIINPTSLNPENYYVSVSVYCESAALADALSTALFSMTYAEGEKFLESFEHVEALWIMTDGSMKGTEGISLN